MNMSPLRTIKYMNRSYFSKARYMIGVGFKILGRTPVPKLPPSNPPPPRDINSIIYRYNWVDSKVNINSIIYSTANRSIGHCIATSYAVFRYLVKLTELETIQ